jgi:dienelactone hydrolase
MTLTLPPTRPAVAPTERLRPGLDRRLAVALTATGSALALVVALDGSPGWRLVRLVAVLALTAAAIIVLPRLRPLVRGCAVVVSGFVAVAVGAGLAVPHLARAWSVTAVVGLATLAAGVVTVGLAVILLVRHSRGWWRSLLAAAVVLSGYLVVWPVTHAVIATNVAPTPLSGRDPSALGLRYETVSFSTGAGVPLSGWYLPSTGGAAVVLLHGAGSNRADTLDHAAVLARHGYGVLLLDARGHGASGGRAMDFGWFGDTDVIAAAAYLRGRPDVDDDRVGAVGLSMGGEEAVGAAGRARLRAVVAEGATNRVAADRTWFADEFGVAGQIQVTVDRLTYGLTDLLTDASPPLALRDAVAAAPGSSVLLVTAGRVPDEALAARSIRGGSPATVETWDVPDAGHTGGLATRPAEWEAHVTTFLDQHLGASS